MPLFEQGVPSEQRMRRSACKAGCRVGRGLHLQVHMQITYMR